MQYTYAGTRAYTHAHSLLSETDFERLLTARDGKEALRVLDDTFLAEQITRFEGDVDAATEHTLLSLKHTVQSYVPNQGIVNAFWSRFDFFNLSIIEKAKRLQHDHAHILSELSHLGTIDPEKLLTLIEHGALHAVSPLLAETQKTLAALTAVALIDITSELGYMRHLADSARAHHDVHFKAFAQAHIDAFNLKAALRYHNGLDAALTTLPFAPRGTCTMQELGTREGVLAALHRVLNEDVHANTMQEIEKKLHTHILTQQAHAAHDIFSSAPVLLFLTRLISHIEIIRAVIRSKFAHIREEDIRAFVHER